MFGKIEVRRIHATHHNVCYCNRAIALPYTPYLAAKPESKLANPPPVRSPRLSAQRTAAHRQQHSQHRHHTVSSTIHKQEMGHWMDLLQITRELQESGLMRQNSLTLRSSLVHKPRFHATIDATRVELDATRSQCTVSPMYS